MASNGICPSRSILVTGGVGYIGRPTRVWNPNRVVWLRVLRLGVERVL